MIPSSPSFKQQLGDLSNQKQVLENKIQLHTVMPETSETSETSETYPKMYFEFTKPRPYGTVYCPLSGEDLRKANEENPYFRVVNEKQRVKDVRIVIQLQSKLKDLDKKIEGLRKQNFPPLSNFIAVGT